jgi:hypothetical protein
MSNYQLKICIKEAAAGGKVAPADGKVAPAGGKVL